MATLVFGAVGTAIGGPLGGFIGATIGSAIDNFLIIPALTGKQTIKGPQIDDINLMLAKEGSPIPFVLGPENRVGGLLAWKSDIDIATSTSSQGGGKGTGGGANVESKSVFTDVRVHCTETTDEPIIAIDRIWANDKVIYADGGPTTWDGTYESDEIGIWSLGTTTAISPYSLGGQTVTRRSGKKCRMVSWDPDVDLTLYSLDERVLVDGATLNLLNNRAVVINKGSGSGIKPGAGTTEDYTFVDLQFNHRLEYPIGPVSGSPRWEVNLEGPISIEVVNSSKRKSYFTDITIHTGGIDQTTPIGLMEEYEGAGNVPGYVNFAGFTIEALDLTDFGNLLPRFNALVRERESLTCGEAIEIMLSRSNLPDELFDASAATGVLRGLNTSGPTPLNRVIEILSGIYDLVVREVDGVYIFEPRTNTVDFTINPDHLGAGQSGTQRVRDVLREREESRQLPDEVVINFTDPDRDYQVGSRRVRKINSPRRNVITIEAPITMTNELAGEVIDRVLWQAWTDRDQVRFTLPPRYINLRPGDLVAVTDEEGENFNVRITEITMGQNFVMAIRGVIEDELSLDPISDSDASATPGSSDVSAVYNMQPYVWTGPALREADLNSSGFYTSLTNLVISAPFRTSRVFVDKGQTGVFESSSLIVLAEAIAGSVVSNVEAGPIGYWDLETEIVVDLTNGILSSATEDEVLAGANRAMVGGELIGFVNAVSLGVGQFRISKLLRGLRDTELEMNEQAGTGGMQFILLQSSTVVFYSQPISELGKVYDFKGVPTGEDEALFFTTETEVHDARNLRPFAVTNIQGVRDSGDLTVSWDRRSRGFWPLFVSGGMPRWDPDEVYRVQELDAPGGNVVSEVLVDALTTHTFSAASDPFYVRISRVSGLFGDGPSKEATL